MADLNDISINITMNTSPLSTKGFALPLVLGSRETGGDDEALIETYGEYSSPEEMIEAGFRVDDDEYKMACLMFAQSPRPSVVAVYCRDSESGINEVLAELVLTHNDWYALLITERDKESLAEAGDFAMSHEKMFFGCTTDLTALEGRNNKREVYLIHDKADRFYEAAWVGMCLPKPIGSITWKFKAPTGVLPADYSTTELREIRTNRGQTFTKRSGVIYANEGITTGNEYIDNMMSRDYVKARLEESLFNLEIKSDKVSFDGDGLTLIEAALIEVFDNCGEAKIIAKVENEEDAKKSDKGKYMYKVSVPERSSVPEVDRANRRLPGVKFSFTVAGAVHSMDVEGTIEV